MISYNTPQSIKICKFLNYIIFETAEILLDFLFKILQYEHNE